MLSNIIKGIAAIVVVATMVSCTDDPMGKPLQQTHNLENKKFPLTVMVFESERQLQRHLRKQKLTDALVLGFAAWALRADDRQVVTDCTIYVVRPKGLKDNNRFETWGHELTHCVYGTFHQEKH